MSDLNHAEIDLQIAEKVMGWKLLGDDLWLPSKEFPCRLVSEDNRLHTPKFSSEIQASMLVVEKMRNRFPSITLNTIPSGGWEVIMGKDIDTPSGISSGPDLATAICCCALGLSERPKTDTSKQLTQ